MSAAQQDSDVGTLREKPAVRKRAPAKKAPAKRTPKVEAPQPDEPIRERPPEEFTILGPPSKVTIEAGGEQFLSVEEFRKRLAGPPDGLYPEDAELFSFTPLNRETIWFPLSFEQPDAVWLWELYEKPFHIQSWEWMKLAQIPKSMQRKAVELMRDNPDEYLELFGQWFKAMSGGSANLGE
jgi:hypothetical protein